MARTKGRRSRPARRGHFRSPVRRWLWLGAGALLLTLILYVVYLDRIVQQGFAGRRWSLPAQVYGRPLRLYPDAPLDARRLTLELQGLGYRRVKHPDRPGSYSSYKGRFLLRTRPFRFPGGQRPSDYLEVRFQGHRLYSLKRAGNGARLTGYRLEPRRIGSLHPANSEDRILLRRSELPEGLVKALIAVEDREFYQHIGIDLGAMVRAGWANLRAAGVVQGGSTLTQQLVKNFFLSPQRTLWRKFNEVLMALLLEARYSKDQILEAYANEVYLGQDGGRAIHGFGLASQFYFNRPLHELDLPRIALLVALVRGPSAYEPRRHPQRARKRRALVLRIMAEQGLIGAKLASQAAAAPLGVEQGRRRASGAPAFMELIRRQLRRDYREADLDGEGLRIFSTLDPWAQGEAEQALASGLQRLEKSHSIAPGGLQGALVLADAISGEVSALVGGRQAAYAGFNRALDAVRPVGSLIKPAVYLTALLQPQSYRLTSRLDDGPIRLRAGDGQLWTPRNYDRHSHGEVTLEEALANSYNQATVRLGMRLGLVRVLKTLRSLGIKRPLEPFPSLLLGAARLSPLEVAQMYQTLAAGGSLAPLKAIRAVTDHQGRVLSRYPLAASRAVDPRSVFLLRHALQEVVSSGTGKGLAKLLSAGARVAGKTGTTDQLRDSWFAGFDRRHVAVVWVGRDDNGSTRLTGASGAMRIWGRLLRRLGVVSLSDRVPVGVELVEIDPASGRLGKGCADARELPFIQGSAPRERAPCASGLSSKLDEGIGWLRRLFR